MLSFHSFYLKIEHLIILRNATLTTYFQLKVKIMKPRSSFILLADIEGTRLRKLMDGLKIERVNLLDLLKHWHLLYKCPELKSKDFKPQEMKERKNERKKNPGKLPGRSTTSIL